MSFQDIKGQDKPIQILREYIKENRLTGSYLFLGEEGIGKKLVAKTLAKALNCAGQTLDSCDKCDSCLKIEKGQHPDVHIIDGPASLTINPEHSRRIDGSSTSGINPGHSQGIGQEETDSIKIEYIRQLQKDINLKPYEGKKKVFILDNAHNLTAEASNALLKILEEPPDASLIILVSAKPALLFRTIISRCKTMKFYPLQRTKLEEFLRKDFNLNANQAHYLAYFCEGRIGRALKLKDTDILSKKNSVIDTLALARSSGPDKFSTESKNDLRAHLNILASWFRDMYLIKTGAPYSELINLDRKEELLRLMHRYSFIDLDAIFSSISSALLYLERNVNAKLLLSNLRWSLKVEA